MKFGEAWQDALKREILEELEAEIVLTSQPLVMENIYYHHGMTGHEVVFLSNARFVDEALYHRDELEFIESDGVVCKARWFNLRKLEAHGPELFPTGLLDKMLAEV